MARRAEELRVKTGFRGAGWGVEVLLPAPSTEVGGVPLPAALDGRRRRLRERRERAAALRELAQALGGRPFEIADAWYELPLAVRSPRRVARRERGGQ